jgi:hypothetical protein
MDTKYDSTIGSDIGLVDLGICNLVNENVKQQQKHIKLYNMVDDFGLNLKRKLFSFFSINVQNHYKSSLSITCSYYCRGSS